MQVIKFGFTALFLLVCSQGIAQVDRFYGEPVELKSNFIYFTSWKYVRQGSFGWQIEHAPDATEEEKNVGAWLEGDGTRPARFTVTDMPRGIRLEAQQAEKRPFQPGQIAAQVFDDGKYKAWYTMGPCAEPEPYSSKDKILPGYNSHIAYAESADGEKWDLPKLGLYDFAGNKDNNIVFRGDLNGSTRGFHGGSVFVDPPPTNATRCSSRHHHRRGMERLRREISGRSRHHGTAVTALPLRRAVFGASPDGLH